MGVTVIVANAPWSWTRAAVALASRAELLLAADGGANHLARIGLRPAAVVGDLDSIRPEVRRWVGESHIVQRTDQDTTDLHKTLAYAVGERGARRVTVLAIAGGRLDHAMESLALLARWSARAEIDAWDGTTRIVPVTRTLELALRPGQTVSLLPLGRCEGVRTSGLRWALAGDALDLGERTGISNLAAEPRVAVSLEKGALLVFVHDDAGPDAAAAL